MKKTLKAIVIVGIFGVLSSISHAGEFGLVCDNCSDNAYKTAAENSAGLGYHTVWVFDTERWKATQWSVSVEQEGPMTIRFAVEQQLDSAVSTGFDKYREITEDFLIPSSFRPIDLPSNLFASVYDVAGNPDALNELLNWYRADQNAVTWTIGWAVSAAIELTNKISSLKAAVKFKFDDGSSLIVTLEDWDPTDFTFKFVFKSALDSNGNVVPINANEYDPNDPVNSGIGAYLGNGGVPYSIYDSNGNLLSQFSPTKCYDTDCEFVEGVYKCKLIIVAGTCYSP